MTDPMLIVPGVESVTVRSVWGLDGDQVELQIRTRKDELVVRLQPRRGRAIRITNLRKRDKRATPKTTVPFLRGEEG